MTAPRFNTRPLILTQQLSWYGTIVLFALAAIAYIINLPVASAFARAGVLFVLAATLAKLIVLAEQFRINRLYSYLLLSGLLILILGVTIIVRLFG